MKTVRVFLFCMTAAFGVASAAPAVKAEEDANLERNISLSGNDWRICSDPERSGTERRLFDADPATSEWIPAAVPGNVQADLEAAHLLTPLWYGEGDLRVYDVPRSDWWYRKDFTVPASFAGKRVALVFDGVDYECEVWLNGKRLGGNVGMFRRFSFDVADALLPGRPNRLAVRIARMPPELAVFFERANENRMYDGVFFEGLKQMLFQLKELKSPTNLGWDWGTNIWTLGIWKDVRLAATGPARIENTRVQCALNDSYTQATITPTLEIDSLDARPVRVTFRVVGNGQEASAASDATLAPGRNIIKAAIPLDRPALWWPNGQGEQPLYMLKAEICPTDGGPPLDISSTRFAIRDVQWVHTEGAPADFISRYQLVVNGRPVRTMGSNLVPPDLLFGRATQRALHLLHRAKAAGMNTLRLWGGGVTLSDEFYSLADELGIMLSFEFFLANTVPPTDEVFLANLEATSRNILKQVRNHPSIIEYSGGNEMPWNSQDQHPALLLLRKVVAEEDGRLFRATCPDLGAKHGPWVFFVDETALEYNAIQYNTVETMRAGEFGTVSPANLEVWHRDTPPSSQAAVNRTDDPVLVHKNAVQGAGRPQDWLGKPYIDELFDTRDDLPKMVEAGQFLGADGLRYAMDALRRKGKRIGGFTNWDFNEPWTNAAGSYMVDYDGRPLMNYDFVRQALAPVSLSLCYNSILYRPAEGIHAELFLTSDAPQTVAGLRWKWLARDRRGAVFAQGEGDASIEPIETKSLAKLDIQPPTSTAFGPVFVELRLEGSDGKTLGERICVFGMAGVPGPLAGLLKNNLPDPEDDASPEVSRPVRRTSLAVTAAPPKNEGGQEVLELVATNQGSMTALFCEPHPLVEYRTDLFIDNNHCFIPPGESRTITIKAKNNSGRLTLGQTGWRISCWNADDVVVEPSADVLLAVGRKDAMCREFLGYLAPSAMPENAEITLSATRPDPSTLPFLMAERAVARFKFNADADRSGRKAALRLHTADQSADTAAAVEILLNGRPFDLALPKGLGIQRNNPSHLAFPHTAEVQLPPGTLLPGENVLELRIANSGWFTWDALDICTENR